MGEDTPPENAQESAPATSIPDQPPADAPVGQDPVSDGGEVKEEVITETETVTEVIEEPSTDQ